MISKIGMYQSPLNYHKSNVSFKSGEKADNLVPKKFETEATNVKKLGVGLASLFIPGLGQAINGQDGKAILHLVATLATAFISVPLLFNKKLGAGIAMLVASYGINIYSSVDAMKNAKSEVIQMVPAEKADANKDAADTSKGTAETNKELAVA